jgi:hypothetical protein
MLIPEKERCVELKWTAILSYIGSVAVSLAIWIGLIRVAEHFMK